MPLIRVQISQPVDEPTRADLLARLSQTGAQALGKPESYMMVVLESEVAMLMGGEAQPAALVEVRSVGTIDAPQAKTLSGMVSELLSQTGVDPRRIYTVCAGVPGAMWGQGSNTFG